jgi:hypothetical protein
MVSELALGTEDGLGSTYRPRYWTLGHSERYGELINAEPTIRRLLLWKPRRRAGHGTR